MGPGTDPPVKEHLPSIRSTERPDSRVPRLTCRLRFEREKRLHRRGPLLCERERVWMLRYVHGEETRLVGETLEAGVRTLGEMRRGGGAGKTAQRFVALLFKTTALKLSRRSLDWALLAG